jgi:cytochrome c
VRGRYLPAAGGRTVRIARDARIAENAGSFHSQFHLTEPFMKPVRILALAGITLIAAPAMANEELAKKHACTACHAVDKKVVGPSFKEVAAKYKGNAKAEAMLVDKVKKGGVGTWGQVPMPPNASVPDADVNALVKWVLGLK